MVHLIEREGGGIGAGDAGQLVDGDEKGKQGDTAEGDGVAGGAERSAEGGLDAECVAEMASEFGERIALDAEGGELPEAGEESAGGAIYGMDEEGAAMRVEEDGGGEADSFGRALAAAGGDGIFQAERAGAAEAGDGTFGAGGIARSADGGAELHHGLVPGAGGARDEQMLGFGFELMPAGGLAEIAANGAETGENASDVAVENGERSAVGDAQNGGGGVAADAGESESGFLRSRKFTGVEADDFFCGAMEIARAGVVAEASPGFEDGRFGRTSEGANGGKPCEETLVIGEDGGDARLLQHDFGDPDAVGIAGSAPGESALVGVEPGEEAAAEGGELTGGRVRDQRRRSAERFRHAFF